ncbi:MAG: LacI family DNA-binding transcriptional regulator [Arachnia sp.]
MATIYEVAALAGVSPSTVSRVFSGAATVSPQKAEAVRRAAADLRFTPDKAARAMRTRSTDVIGLIIPDVENPYFTEVARGVEDRAREAGYSVVLCNSDAILDKEATYLQVAMAERMAGVIVAPASPATDLGPVISNGQPVVVIDRGTSSAVDTVVMANREAGATATSLLLAAGYRRLACITGPADIDTAKDRSLGWHDALVAAGRPADPGLVRYSSFHVDGGRSAMTDLLTLPDPPDGVVAGNNMLGVGALQVLSERASAPPITGVSVVGSLPYTTIAPSAVSVVRLPSRTMGAEAARMLLARIGGDAAAPRHVVLRGQLQ